MGTLEMTRSQRWTASATFIKLPVPECSLDNRTQQEDRCPQNQKVPYQTLSLQTLELRRCSLQNYEENNVCGLSAFDIAV